MSRIITIGREFGSGGRELGRRLAEELGIQYYDKEILTAIAGETAMTEEYIQRTMERRPFQLLPITIGHSMSIQPDYQLMQMQEIFSAQTDIIRGLADKGDCVIIGRCADYILRDRGPLRVFVYADLEAKVARCMERRTESEKDLTEQDLRRKIPQVDKARAAYYNDYTGQRWGDKKYYDLCINTTHMVIKDVVPYMAKMFR